MADTIDQWREFLNPEAVRTKLISAGMFLIAHELLIDTIKRHPLSFFADEWGPSGPKESTAYKKEVRALDPDGKGDALRGSINWLQKLEAINGEDAALIKRVTDSRNTIAHELTSMIGGERSTDFAEDFEPLMYLVQKIEEWWLLNVELDANPDIDGSDVDENGIITGPTMIMHILGQVALGDEEKSWELYRQFCELENVQKKDSETRFVDLLLEGLLGCKVGLTANGAVITPLDDRDVTVKMFQSIVDELRTHDGEGYDIAQIASSLGPETDAAIDHVEIWTHA